MTHPDKMTVTEEWRMKDEIGRVKNEIVKQRFFVKSMKEKILDGALSLPLALLIIPSRCSLKLSKI